MRQIGFGWYDLWSFSPQAESLIGATAGGCCERPCISPQIRYHPRRSKRGALIFRLSCRFRVRRSAPTPLTRLVLQANILITNETPPRACISDFGLCAIVATTSFGTTRVDAGGTPGHMAPELISSGAKTSKEADMYAFGMVVYEVIAGTHPYRLRKVWEIPILTIQGSRPSRPEAPVPAGFGQGTWEFAERCWDENPTQRPSARAALEHFERVARISTVVDPGLSIRVQEPVDGPSSRTEGSSRNFCEYHGWSTVPPH